MKVIDVDDKEEYQLERFIEKSLNSNIADIDLSATLAINERSKALQLEGKSIYRLGLGQSPFPVPDKVVAALVENSDKKDYLPVKGLPALRRAVASFHQRNDDCESSEEDVLIGPGSKELLFILQLVFPGELLLPAPSWVSYAPQAQILGRPVQWISTSAKNHWRLTASDLEKVCQPNNGQSRLLILNYPSNPTGCSYTVEELQALAVVAKRYSLLILADEIYGQLHFKGEHYSISHDYPEGTIISSGLSKWCGAGGWRLGTFVFPNNLRWLLDSMAIVASETFTSVSAPIQYAAVTAFQGGGEIDTYLYQSRRILKALSHYCVGLLNAANLTVEMPDGAFYLFPSFEHYRSCLLSKDLTTSKALCEKVLVDTGVAMLPGSDFGCPSSEFSIRLALVDFDGERALAAAAGVPIGEDLDHKFLCAYCHPVVEAIEHVVEWVGVIRDKG